MRVRYSPTLTVDWHYKGFLKLRMSGQVKSDIARRARNMAATDPDLTVGEMFESGGIAGRPSITVYAAPHNRDALVRALDAGRR